MKNKIFNIIRKDKKSKARIGILQTKSGKVETPFFMPVATKTSVKHISSEDLESMNARAIISNSYVLGLQPGQETIKKAGGIGKFMKYPGVTFTDSGGFQMYSKILYLSSNDFGVTFKNPFSGEKIFMTPEKSMRLQLDLGADVAMCLDSMPLLENSKEEIKKSCDKTFDWAKKCKQAHDLMQKNILKNKRQLLFGISQGGIHADLRKKSCEQISSIDFDGYAIGGLALGEEKKDEYKMIDVAKKVYLEDKPIYLMGAGNPVELLEAISRGVDIFDSRFPTQNARRGTIFTSKGRLILKSAKHKQEFIPLDKNCDCFVCKRYSRAYLRYLILQGEGNGYRLVSYHNLYFMQKLMIDARKAIKKGNFLEFMKKFKKNYKNRTL